MILEKIVEFVLSPTGLGYVALIVVAVLGIIAKRIPAIEKVRGSVIKAMLWAEKAGQSGEFGEEITKETLFLNKFKTLYEDEKGKPPDKTIERAASDMVEKMIYEMKIKEPLKTNGSTD